MPHRRHPRPGRPGLPGSRRHRPHPLQRPPRTTRPLPAVQPRPRTTASTRRTRLRQAQAMARPPQGTMLNQPHVSARSPARPPSKPPRPNSPPSAGTGRSRPCTTSATPPSARTPAGYVPETDPAPWPPSATSRSPRPTSSAGPTTPLGSQNGSRTSADRPGPGKTAERGPAVQQAAHELGEPSGR
ncbi:hypothetical protein AOB60_01190 [Streptomyces noursei]|uniref:Uncharacterized protein n=1 Tax=Streptomyces noursei TaxID=1971 RepID=A0A2N8PR77_STRNR|nr:hypothetical protein AOB60_01190 [Streptomyces noursei]